MTLRDEMDSRALESYASVAPLGLLEIVIAPEKFSRLHGDLPLEQYRQFYERLNVNHGTEYDFIEYDDVVDVATYVCVRASDWKSMLEFLKKGEASFPPAFEVQVPAAGWHFGRVPAHETEFIFVGHTLLGLFVGVALEKMPDEFKYQNLTSLPRSLEQAEDFFRRGQVRRRPGVFVLGRSLELGPSTTAFAHDGESRPALKLDPTELFVNRSTQRYQRYFVESEEGLVTNPLAKVRPSTTVFPTKPLVPSIKAAFGPAGQLAMELIAKLGGL